MQYFPPLQFYHIEMNFTFELTYKDLFIEKYDKLILLIFFEQRGSTWRLGKPYLKKYQFIMNQDAKIVGFYEKNGYEKQSEKTEKTNNSGQNNFILIISVISVSIIILIVLGVFIGKYLFKKKKRLNRLDDEYEYTEDKNEKIIN